MSTAEAAQKAVEELDKKELDGRQVIVEIAKPAKQKDRGKREKRPRGSQATGEVRLSLVRSQRLRPMARLNWKVLLLTLKMLLSLRRRKRAA